MVVEPSGAVVTSTGETGSVLGAIVPLAMPVCASVTAGVSALFSASIPYDVAYDSAAPCRICPGVSPLTAPAVALATAAPNGPAMTLPAIVARVPQPPGIIDPTALSKLANALPISRL